MLMNDELYFTEEDRAEIHMCLNCPLPECWDCARWGRSPEEMLIYTRIPVQRLIELYNRGATAERMAQEFGLTSSAMRNRLRSMHLPSGLQQPRPVLTVEYLRGLSKGIKRNLIF